MFHNRKLIMDKYNMTQVGFDAGTYNRGISIKS